MRGFGATNEHEQKAAASDDKGNFRFVGLTPGPYRLVSLGGSEEENGEPLEFELAKDRNDILFEVP